MGNAQESTQDVPNIGSMPVSNVEPTKAPTLDTKLEQSPTPAPTKEKGLDETLEKAKAEQKGFLTKVWDFIVHYVYEVPRDFIKSMFAKGDDNLFKKLYDAGKAAILRGWENIKGFFTDRDQFAEASRKFGSALVMALKLAVGIAVLNYAAMMFGITTTIASIIGLSLLAFGVAVFADSRSVKEQMGMALPIAA